jgi:exosome complex component RRP4
MAENDNNTEKKERKLVIPGEIVISGDDYLPGDFTRKEGKDIISNRYGLADTSGRVVKIIPISGVFEPRRGNTVIGRVDDISFNGWMIDIGGPYSSFLPLMECPRFINRNNIAEFANIGDVMTAKILGIKKGGIDLTLKFKGLGKLDGGRVIKINPNKVPRVIGKEGSMINLIKTRTNTDITVGQNGYIWMIGDLEGEDKAQKAIELVVEESTSSGLTEKIEEFLGGKLEEPEYNESEKFESNERKFEDEGEE